MRNFIILLVFSIFSITETPAEALGRLFFTQQQREQIEYEYAHTPPPENNKVSTELKVNGIVQQNNGARTVWINGLAQNSRHPGDTAAENVAIPGKSQTIRLKVGQTIMIDTAAPQSSPEAAE
jgi:hypothetical protein